MRQVEFKFTILQDCLYFKQYSRVYYIYGIAI